MRYSVDRVLTSRGVEFRIVLWFEREVFTSAKTYARMQDADKAALAIGAIPKEEPKQTLKDKTHG